MRVYSVAMAEVQEDSIDIGVNSFLDWDEAVDEADDFMKRCVGDFLEIDPACTEERRAKLEELVDRKFEVSHGMRRLTIRWNDPNGALLLCACVSEKDARI